MKLEVKTKNLTVFFMFKLKLICRADNLNKH